MRYVEKKGNGVNCITCGTGCRWWYDKTLCLTCHGNPITGKGARADWEDWDRAKAVKMFGPRRPGDEELLERYKDDYTVSRM